MPCWAPALQERHARHPEAGTLLPRTRGGLQVDLLPLCQGNEVLPVWRGSPGVLLHQCPLPCLGKYPEMRLNILCVLSLTLCLAFALATDIVTHRLGLTYTATSRYAKKRRAYSRSIRRLVRSMLYTER